jgi:hypothetical protein
VPRPRARAGRGRARRGADGGLRRRHPDYPTVARRRAARGVVAPKSGRTDWTEALLTEESGKTTLLITHDLSEAVLMSDRILVLSECPGQVVAEITVDRAHPLKRRVMPEVGEYAGQIFQHLKLEESHLTTAISHRGTTT